eukprot:g5163.t1
MSGPANYSMPCSDCDDLDEGYTRMLCPQDLQLWNHYDENGCVDHDNKNAAVQSWGFTMEELGRNPHLVVPDFVTHIPRNAFRECDFLESITLHRDIQYIDEDAFKFASNLQSVAYDYDLRGVFSKRDKMIRIGPSAFKQAAHLVSVNISFAHVTTMIEDHAFQGCESLAEVHLPTQGEASAQLSFSDYDTYWNNYQTWRNTPSLECFDNGPGSYMMPCSSCNDVGEGFRDLCPDEEPTPTTTEAGDDDGDGNASETGDPEEDDQGANEPVNADEESDSDVLTIVALVAALLFVGTLAVFFMCSRAHSKRSGTVVPVAQVVVGGRDSSSSDSTKSSGVLRDGGGTLNSSYGGVAATKTLSPVASYRRSKSTKAQCKELVETENLRWDKHFEEVFALLSDEDGYCNEKKFAEIVAKRVVEREDKKRHEYAIGVKLLNEELHNVDNLSGLPDEWRKHIVPKDSPDGKRVFDALHAYEAALVERKELSPKDFKQFSDILKFQGQAFFKKRIEMYSKAITFEPNAETQIAKLTTLLDNRYKHTYDEIFKMQISIGDGVAYKLWLRYAERTRSKLNTSSVCQDVKSDLAKLYLQAAGIASKFDSICRDVAAETGGEFVRAPMKHAFRALEKTALRHVKDERFKCEKVCDVIRGSIVYDNMEGILRGAKLLESGKAGLIVKRFKDRFSEGHETSGGWRDAMFNGYLVGDKNKHIVEIQLQHRALLLVRSDLGGHYMYARFRSLIEALEVCKGADEVTEQRELWREKPRVEEN